MKKYPRVTIRISKELLRKIDKAWKKQRLGGRSAGIKWLIQKGLDALTDEEFIDEMHKQGFVSIKICGEGV